MLAGRTPPLSLRGSASVTLVEKVFFIATWVPPLLLVFECLFYSHQLTVVQSSLWKFHSCWRLTFYINFILINYTFYINDVMTFYINYQLVNSYWRVLIIWFIFYCNLININWFIKRQFHPYERCKLCPQLFASRSSNLRQLSYTANGCTFIPGPFLGRLTTKPHPVVFGTPEKV